MGVAGIGRSCLGGSGGMPPVFFLNFEPSKSGSEASSETVSRSL